MRSIPKLYLAGLGFLVTAILLVLIFTRHPQPAAPEASSYSEPDISNYLAARAEERADARDQQDEAARRTRKAAEKKSSPECQFWQQQHSKKPTSRSEEKVAQFCVLSDTTN